MIAYFLTRAKLSTLQIKVESFSLSTSVLEPWFETNSGLRRWLEKGFVSKQGLSTGVNSEKDSL